MKYLPPSFQPSKCAQKQPSSWKNTKKHPFTLKNPWNCLFQDISIGLTMPQNSLYHLQCLQNNPETFLASALNISQKICFHLYNIAVQNSTKIGTILLILSLNTIITLHFQALIIILKSLITTHNHLSRFL